MTLRAGGYRTVIFDCDSTLTRIEGIDELARLKGLGDEVAELTRQAMEGEVALDNVYRSRLDLLTPTRAELKTLAGRYIAEAVPDAGETISLLAAGRRRVFVVSAGLEPAVVEFARWLGVPTDNVRAVPAQYDQLAGAWHSYQSYGDNPAERVIDIGATSLSRQHGKRDLIAVLPRKGRSMLVGDGMNDWAAHDTVDAFVGFGGVVRRPAVEQVAAVYLTATSLAAILPLALSPVEAAALDTEGRKLFEKGVRNLQEGVTVGVHAVAAVLSGHANSPPRPTE